jgi:hypothetical protein
LEIWYSWTRVGRWLENVPGTKTILYADISRLTRLKRSYVRFEFDGGDEVVISERVLESLPEQVAGMVEPPSGLSVGQELTAVRQRQAMRGSVTWPDGRRSFPVGPQPD